MGIGIVLAVAWKEIQTWKGHVIFMGLDTCAVWTPFSTQKYQNHTLWLPSGKKMNILIHIRTFSLTWKFIFMLLVLKTWKHFRRRPPSTACPLGSGLAGPNGKASLEIGHLTRQAVDQDFWQRGANMWSVFRKCVFYCIKQNGKYFYWVLTFRV